MPTITNRRICPICKRIIEAEDVRTWDELSRKEFSISGMCLECQNSFFEHKGTRGNKPYETSSRL